MSDRRAIEQVVRLLSQAMEDQGLILPWWVHARVMDRFTELAEEAGLRFIPPPEVEPDWHQLITGEDDSQGA